MMWLLSDEEINGAREPHIGTPLRCWPQHRAIAQDQLNKLVTGLIVRTTTTKNFARFKMSMVEWRELLGEAGI